MTEADACRNLFRAVVAKAAKDAFAPRCAGSTQTTAFERSRARNWLTKDNYDFFYVCSLAEVSADRIRAGAKKLINMPQDKQIKLYKRLMWENR